MKPLVLVLVLVAACASTRTPPSPASATAPPRTAAARPADPADRNATGPMPVDPSVKAGVLDNGLHYFLRVHRQPQRRAALRLVVNAGSVLEEEDQRGLAHFIEHMAFNGTRLFKKQELVDFLERAGMRFGSDVNASTTFDETIYTFTVPTDDAAVLARGLLVLQQIAHDVSFEPDEVDRERGVVIEEWRQGLGAEMRVLDQITPVIFKGSLYAERLPIGKMSVLEHAKAEDLRRFYQRWYRPDLMAVVAVGDFDAAAVERELRKTFADIARPGTPAARPEVAVPPQPNTLVASVQDPELPSTTVGVLHKMPRRPEASEGDYRRHIVEDLYHQMLNQRLEELTRSKDPAFLGAGSTTQDLVRPTELFAAVAAVKPDGVARGLEALVRETERIDRHGFTPGELARAKAEQLRRMQALVTERQNLPSDPLADELVRHFLTGEAVPGIEAELRLHQRYLPTVTLPEMNVIARDWLRDEDRVLLVEAPKSAKVPSQDQLLGILHSVERSDLPAYVDRGSDRPLLAQAPQPGKIEQALTVPPVGVTEWRLSNGARVILKPTPFKEDEVLLGAFSAGGTSLVPDRDYLSARFAAEIVGQSGWGPFDPTELRNALAGKLATVSPYIDEVSEGVLGRASPQDLDTMMELVYLSFTAPRRDEGVFSAFKAQLSDQLARRDADPQSAFADRRQTVVYDHTLRRRPLRAGDEEQVKLDRVLEVYRQRFANAADFTFVFVGSFKPEQLAPLVTRYLASLPGHPAPPEQWRDLGIRPAGGVKSFEVRKGREPRSLVDLTFTGPARWSREEAHALRSVVDVLEIRLREVLREDLSGTYSVGVSGDLQRRPDQEYQTEVGFGCAPEKVQSLIAATNRELDAARAGKIAPSYLEKVQAAQRRSLEGSLVTNSFWLTHLMTSYEFGTNPALILHGQDLIDSLSVPRLQQAAARYFDPHRLVTGVLRPEEPSLSGSNQPQPH
jgi:zinc protease